MRFERALTIREQLKSRIFKARCAALGFWLLCAAGMFLPRDLVDKRLLGIPFLGFAGCVLYILLVLRCPRCKARIGQTLTNMKIVNYCPACGVSLDEPAGPR